VVEAHREGVVDVSVPPKRTPPNRRTRAPFEQQADQLQEVLVPAHGDAVLGDAAEAGQHAVAELFEELDSTSRTGAKARARRRVDARQRGSGSILSPSMPTTDGRRSSGGARA
jgi:hypothetical protein